jgi:hypothetical protein
MHSYFESSTDFCLYYDINVHNFYEKRYALYDLKSVAIRFFIIIVTYSHHLRGGSMSRLEAEYADLEYSFDKNILYVAISNRYTVCSDF